MRFATIRSKRRDAGFHPDECAVAQEPTVSRGRIHQLSQLDDETIIMLYELTGDLARAESIMKESPSVLTCEIAGDESGFAYIHTAPIDPAASLLSLFRRNEIIVETPIVYTDKGELRLTLIGQSESLHTVTSAIAKVMEIELETMGTYSPTSRNVAGILTDRQQGILRFAVETGYYEVPRQGSIEEVAAQVGLSEGTVGEHLQKIEREILTRVATC